MAMSDRWKKISADKQEAAKNVKEWHRALAATALILFTPGCTTKTYTVVDENGTPI